MANKIKGLTIKIGADTVGLNDALKDISKKSRSTVQEIGEIDRAIKNTGGSAELWQQKQKLLNTAIEDSKKKLELLEGAQEQLQEKLRIKEISEEQYRAFQRETEYARSAVKKYEDQLEKANDELRNMESSADGAEDEVRELGDAAENTGKGGISALNVALGTLIADGIRASASALKDFTGAVVNTGMTFESSMSGVAAISGASAEDLERLSEKAKEMGATTKYTAAQSADAFGYMALAGWKTEDMLAGIDGVLSLAAASDMDLATASDIVTDYLTAFGLTAQDSARFVDMMSYAMANSNTTTELLGEAYKNCAATAASMGYSVEDTTAVLMTMANAGVKGGEAGTALNAIMTRLATDTKNCATELANYGVQVYDSEGNMQSLSSILEGVSGVWENLTDQEQANMAKIIAGTNHYSALQTIMNGLSDSAEEAGMSFGDYSAALSECDGTAQGMADTMQDNLSGDLTVLSSAVDGMKLSLADELTPVLRDTTQFLTSNISAVQDVLTPLMKTGADGISFVIKSAPKAISILKGVAPVAVGIGSAFAAWKIAGIVNSAATAVQALNLTMLANPAVAVTVGIVGLTTAIVALKLASDDEATIASEVTEEFKQQRNAIENTRDSINNMKSDFDDKARSIEEETTRTENLWKELDKLTDASGRVKDADKVRADYILGELNNALGTEYSMTGNQIENYKRLSSQIDTVIAKKKAEAYLDDYLAMASGMAKNKEEAMQQYSDLYNQEQEAEKERAAAAIDYEQLTGYSVADYDPKELLDSRTATKEQKDAANRFLTAKERENEIKSDMNLARSAYMQAADYFSKLEDAETAFSEERYDDISGILYSEKNANTDILKDTKATLDERLRAYDSAINTTTGKLKLALKSASQDEMNIVINAMAETITAGQEIGLKGGELISGEIAGSIQEMLDNGFDISQLAEWGKDSGIDIGDIFSVDFSEVIQKQLDAGYDIGDLLRWGTNSGKDVGDNFRNKYTSIVQSQLNKGYDIQELLVWGQNSGINISTLFSDEFTKKFQSTLDYGFDCAGLVQWAVTEGWNLGDVFGENFQTAYTQYLYDENGANMKVPKSINSPGDVKAATWWNGDYLYYPHNAVGGYINQRGIVAEAGPELLEIINGGIRVTPLTDSARNTIISPEQNGGSTVITNYITAQVSGRYDVYKLAEDLANAERIIYNGKGIRK